MRRQSDRQVGVDTEIGSAEAAIGVLALTLAAAQAAWPERLGADGLRFVTAWISAAAVAGGLVAAEALERARRLHGGLADRLLASTMRLLLPFGAAGAIVTLAIVRAAPEAIWILPGLWQLLVALIGFAGVAMLPPAIVWAAGWYFACGAISLAVAGEARAPAPWLMGLPFGIGQLLVAGILHRAGRDGR